MDNHLNTEDYQDPVCPFDVERFRDEPTVHSVNIGRVIEKVEEYYASDDYSGAERHLKYWLSEAELGHDKRGALSIHNELMGLYRKTGNREKAFENAIKAADLVSELGLGGTVTAGTTYLNAGTVYKEFGEQEQSLDCFEKALNIYETQLPADDPRMGGLYNNMAITLAGMEKYDLAFAYFEKALGIMEHAEHGALEQAITYLNMADAVNARDGAVAGADVIDGYLDTAQSLLDSPDLPRNGYYAFVCRKSAPTFSYFGRFFYSRELEKRADMIYAGT